MKPMLKPPGTKHLKLEHEKLLSKFAFNINLRRYNMEVFRGTSQFDEMSEDVRGQGGY